MEATREIKMTIEVLKAFKITPGKSMEKAAEAVKVGEFKQVPLRSSKENVNRFLFLQAIIDSLSSLSSQSLKKLLTASKTYLASSSECERGFSVLNVTATDARNRLQLRSLSAVLFIDINGPPLKMFDAYPYIQSWLREKSFDTIRTLYKS